MLSQMCFVQALINHVQLDSLRGNFSQFDGLALLFFGKYQKDYTKGPPQLNLALTAIPMRQATMNIKMS